MSQSPRAGFTLIELMVVVVIIAIVATLFMPGFSSAMAMRRASLVARDLVRVGRRAQAEAMGNQRAHLVYLGPEEIRLVRGLTSSCLDQDWVARAAECLVPTAAGPGNCLERIDLTTERYSRDPYLVTLFAVAGPRVVEADEAALSVALCYAPSGAVYSGAGTTLANATSTLSDVFNVTAQTAGGSGLTVRVKTVARGKLIGVSRHVLFPKGTTPKVIQ